MMIGNRKQRCRICFQIEYLYNKKTLSLESVFSVFFSLIYLISHLILHYS